MSFQFQHFNRCSYPEQLTEVLPYFWIWKIWKSFDKSCFLDNVFYLIALYCVLQQLWLKNCGLYFIVVIDDRHILVYPIVFLPFYVGIKISHKNKLAFLHEIIVNCFVHGKMKVVEHISFSHVTHAFTDYL